MKIGISISTYSNIDTPIARYDIIDRCLQSLADNLPGNIYVNIVIDGDITKQHQDILDKYPFELIKRSYNGGISKCKNTGIKSIIDNGCEIGFLCDDDLLFKSPDVFTKYAEAMMDTNIPHMCLFLEDNGVNCETITYKNTNIKKTPWVNGCLLTFTRNLIEEVGYFKIFPYKYGHEHSNFTRRCVQQGRIPHYTDIINSSDYVIIQADSLNGNKSVGLIDDDKFKKNAELSVQNLSDYIKFKD